jgi:hypothetical protein
MVDIYYLSESDEKFDLNKLDENDPIMIYINQIKMVLSTETIVMGAKDLSIDLEKLIYETNIDNLNLEKRIFSKIEQYCSLFQDYPTSVRVQYFKGEERDICLIDILINDIKIQYLVK